MKLMIIPALALAIAAPARAEKVVLEGSTTVLPIAQHAAEDFMKLHKDADISVRGGGSGVGIASILDGACDIADASRAIQPSEIAEGKKRGKDIRPTIIAMDGIAPVVHPSNPVKGLTKEQIKDIYTGKVSNWSAVGGPDLKIVVVSRDSSSGTFEAFNEMVLSKEKVRPDAIMQASNQEVAGTVSRTPGAIGYVGLGYLSGSIKALSVNGVIPSKATVLRHKYPVSRPLYMYTNGAPAGTARQFLAFVKSKAGQKIVEAEGFVGLK
jgi:phosphate transport system substrate-binding protein